MRAFIALNLPHSVCDELALVSANHPNLRAKWVKPGSMHMTLQFFDHLPEADLSSISKLLLSFADDWDNRSAASSNFEIRPGRNPMLWLTATLSAKQILAIRNLHREIGRLGYEVDARPFQPHVTVARLKDEGEFDSMAIPKLKPPSPFQFVSVDLVKSVLDRSGPIYTALESVPLMSKG